MRHKPNETATLLRVEPVDRDGEWLNATFVFECGCTRTTLYRSIATIPNIRTLFHDHDAELARR
jgi:hypothetical protein